MNWSVSSQWPAEGSEDSRREPGPVSWQAASVSFRGEAEGRPVSSASVRLVIKTLPNSARAWKQGLGESAGHWAFHTNEPGPRHGARQKLDFGG